MNSDVYDLTFITNEECQTLKQRFEVLIKDTRFFDCLVGYFYTSGFYALYKSLGKTEKIRILIGIGTGSVTYDLIDQSQNKQQMLQFSHAETKEKYEKFIESEFAESEDNQYVEKGVLKFVEWIKNNKLEIRAYPSKNIHAKLYIMTFLEEDRDVGRVITGSSNFTQAGLIDNFEFNVELKNRSDYEFAKQKFEELWKDAVDVNEKYVVTIQQKTWLNQNITPYELYLKFLYEYFKDELNRSEELFTQYLPQDFLKLVYQDQAVLNAKDILESYGGVFISDVVGLGKTYISALLTKQLDGMTLVIAPPMLLDKNNPGSWYNVFLDFRIAADFESVGKLDHLLNRGTEKFKNIIIDEAHRFRSETTISYEKLSEICRGKRVILVTATPYNNSPMDILSQIKLFQNTRKSTIPNLPNLEDFFYNLEKRIRSIDRQTNYQEYVRIAKENARIIRERVLRYLMIRRTRSEIAHYFEGDLEKNKLKFPELEKPKPLYYELNTVEDEIFNETIRLIGAQFTYSRYTPMLYSKKPLDQLEAQSQRNMGKFMKVLLIKRLESSFHAFRKSIDRFIYSYEKFIKEYDKGWVYVSKDYINKIFEFLENDDDTAIQRLLDEGQAKKHTSDEFREGFIIDLHKDYDILKRIKELWAKIDRDPKLIKFLAELKNNTVLKNNKVLIFTESKETAEYLAAHIEEKFPGITLCFTGASPEAVHYKVIENFDPKMRHPKNDHRLLVSTEILSEGINLHRSNVVVNYDIPWNPTRMMQRVGRVNRVDTKFDTIYTFNFFPSQQGNDEIGLEEVAKAKIAAFLTLLGGDAMLLTDGEPVGSHELWNRLMSKQTLTGEDDSGQSELKYLQEIKNIREKSPELFEKIKHLPKKARSAKTLADRRDSLITYFRRGKLQKFFLALKDEESMELDFFDAASIIESSADTMKQKLPADYYPLLEKNKQAFLFATTEELEITVRRTGRDNAAIIMRILKATMKNSRQLTDEQEEYVKRVLTRLEEGGLPKQTLKSAKKALDSLKNDLVNPLKVVGVLQTHIPVRLLTEHYAEKGATGQGKREVILSMYLTGE